MMFQIMELEIRRPEMLTQPPRMLEHPQVALAHLRQAAVRPGLEHIARDKGRLRRLHRLVPQYPRLPIMPDVLHIFQHDTGVVEAELNGFVGESAMVLFARKALFFHGGDQFAVFYQRRRRISKCREAENVHLQAKLRSGGSSKTNLHHVGPDYKDTPRSSDDIAVLKGVRPMFVSVPVYYLNNSA